MLNTAFFVRHVGYGFLVWLLASLGFRLFGDVFFLFDLPIVLGALFAAAAVVVPFLTRFGFWICGTPRELSAAAAAAFAAIGMTLDALVTLTFSISYPNMLVAAAAPFAAYMLWCNALALMTGLVIQKRALMVRGL